MNQPRRQAPVPGLLLAVPRVLVQWGLLSHHPISQQLQTPLRWEHAGHGHHSSLHTFLGSIQHLWYPLPSPSSGATGLPQAQWGSRTHRHITLTLSVAERGDREGTHLSSGCLLASPSAQPGCLGPAGLVLAHPQALQGCAVQTPQNSPNHGPPGHQHPQTPSGLCTKPP